MHSKRNTASLMHFAARIATAGTLAIAASAFAAGTLNAEYYPFPELVDMKAIDKDKDGMVSKKEYLDMMSKAWDMNAAKMGVKGAMTPQQFDEVLQYLRAGG